MFRKETDMFIWGLTNLFKVMKSVMILYWTFRKFGMKKKKDDRFKIVKPHLINSTK